MTGFVPKEKLTAYQRWEVAAFDEAEREAIRPAPLPEKQPLTPATTAQDAAVVLPTAADIEKMYNDAHEQGYAAGHAEGFAKANQSAVRINALITSLEKSLAVIDQEVAEQVLALSIEVANQVLRQSLAIRPELVLPVVKESLAALNQHLGHPALFAHPSDAELIRTHLGDQLAHSNWRIIEDNSLTPGGCRVELGASEVDATLETRWRRVIESMGISQEWLHDKR